MSDRPVVTLRRPKVHYSTMTCRRCRDTRAWHHMVVDPWHTGKTTRYLCDDCVVHDARLRGVLAALPQTLDSSLTPTPQASDGDTEARPTLDPVKYPRFATARKANRP